MARRPGSGVSLRRELGLLEYRPVEWILLTGNRLVVSGLLLLVVGVVLFAAVLSGAAPLTQPTPVLFVLFALVGGNFTLVAIVVSISQFVLARHLESPGEIRDRLSEVVGYREAVGEITHEQVIPVTPTAFFLLLFRSIEREAAELDATEWLAGDDELDEAVHDLMTDMSVHAHEVIGLLEDSEGGTRHALFATLNTNYSRYFAEAYRLRAAYGDDIPGTVEESLAGLERHVEQIDVARRYFKTVFIQAELSSLTRLLLYIGPPVQIVSVVLMLLFSAPGEVPVPEPVLAVAIPLVVTAGFAPFALLTAYILRLATVVERTALTYPFSADE